MLVASSATRAASLLRRIGVLLLAFLLLTGVGLFGASTAGATAQPHRGLGETTAQPHRGLGETTAQPHRGLGGMVSQPANDRHRLRLDVDELSPRVVQSEDDTLTISGSITNTGDRRIDDLEGRVELGNRLADGEQARRALQGPLSRYRSTSRFTRLSDSLQPGESISVNLEIPLDGSPEGLAVPRAGVYPLLVNVNGTPNAGGPARLVAFNLLLPVRTAPDAAGDYPDEGSEQPLQLTLLWPIAARHPHVVRDVYGKSLVLSDDSLASSLAPGGRLDGLVDAATEAMERGELASSTCFALEPELLRTVKDMADGYRVRTSDGRVAGEGKAQAKRWLAELGDLVEDRCVIQLPYAGADLDTVTGMHTSQQDDDVLLSLATENAADIDEILGVEPRKHVLWSDHEVSDATLGAAGRAGVTQLITSAEQFPDAAADDGSTGVDVEGTELRGQTFDSLLHRALHAPGGTADIAAQNGIGALLLRIRQERDSDADPVIVAPPQHWNAAPDELSTFLRTLGDLSSDGEIDTVPLQDLLHEDPSVEVSTDPDDSPDANGIPSDELARLNKIDSVAGELAKAMSVDATSLVRPEELVRPLRQGILRTVSRAWRNSDEQRSTALADAADQIDAITSQVTVKPPPQPIALASDDSPLPVYISNNLPVTVTVGVAIRNDRAIRPEEVSYQKIPASSSRNRNINIEPLRAGRISAKVELKTPQGLQLGESTRYELASTQYGTITLVVTAVAGAALLLLASRRIYRRLRNRAARE